MIDRDEGVPSGQTNPPSVVKPGQQTRTQRTTVPGNRNRTTPSSTIYSVPNTTKSNPYRTQTQTNVVTSSGKRYTLDRSTTDWIKNRFKRDWAGTYGYDDDDQLAQKNGQMSAAVRSTYGNKQVDRDLYAMGLPSEKYLEGYIEDYNRWHTGGITQNYGNSVSDDAWTGMKRIYQQSFQYDNSAEDQERKRKGLVPLAMLDKYGDTELDDDLLSKGLPPSSELGKYYGLYNNSVGIENLYANAALRRTALRVDHGIKDDDTKYTIGDEEMTGHDWYAKSFYDELESQDENGNYVYGNIMPLLKNGGGTTAPKSSGDYATDRYNEIAARNKSANENASYDGYSAFSYDDFNSKADDYYNRYVKDLHLYDADGNETKQTVGQAVDVLDRDEDQQAVKDYYTVNYDPNDIGQFVDKYQADYPDASYQDMFTDMFKHDWDEKSVALAAQILQKRAGAEIGKNRTEDNRGFLDVGDAYANAAYEHSSMFTNAAKLPDAVSGTAPAVASGPDPEEVRALLTGLDDALAVYNSAKNDPASQRGTDAANRKIIEAGEKLRNLGFTGEDAAEDARAWLAKNDATAASARNTDANYIPSIGEIDDAVNTFRGYMGQSGEWTEDSARAAFDRMRADGVPENTIQAVALEMQTQYASSPESAKAAPAADKSLSAGERENQLSGEMQTYLDAAKKTAADDKAVVDATRKEILNRLYDEDGNDLVVTDPEAVMKIIEDVAGLDWTNPVAMLAALQDIGFTATDYVPATASQANDWLDEDLQAKLAFDGFSGVADDLTAGWSDADKIRLARSIGANRLIETTGDVGGLGKLFGDTFGSGLQDEDVKGYKKLNYQDFTYALKWAQGQIAAGRLSDYEAYNILAANGLQDEMQTYMGDAWHKAHFKTVVVPQIAGSMQGLDLAAWEEMTPEQRDAMAEQMWANMSAEERAARYGDPNWWKSDSSVYRTFGQSLTQQFEAVLPGLAAEIISAPVKVADAIDARLSGRPEMWDTTQKLIGFQNGISQYGTTSDNVNGAKVAQVVTDAVQELGRMYFYGSIGGAIGAGVAGTAAGGAIAGAAATASSPVTKFAANMFMSLVNSSPFMVSAFANNYAEAKELGANNKEATNFALITGLSEGILEGFEFDQLWGKALGQSKFGAQLLKGKSAFAELGVVAKARIASAAISGLGEFTEESIGYVLETFLKMQHSDTWGRGTEWNASDWIEQAMMGFITGALGGGISSLSSINKGTLIRDYAMSDKAVMRQVFPDVYTSGELWDSWGKNVQDTYRKGGAKVMSVPAYKGTMDAVKSCLDSAQNRVNAFKETQAEEDLKLNNRLRELDGYAAKAQAIDAKTGKGAKELANLVKSKLGVEIDPSQPLAPQVKAAFQARVNDAVSAHDTAIAEARASTETALQNSESELKSLQKQLQEHYAGVYLLSEQGIMWQNPDEVVTRMTQAYQNGATYDPAEHADAENSTPLENVNDPTSPWWSKQKEANLEPARPFSAEDEQEVIQAAEKMRYKGKISFVDEADANWEGKINVWTGDIAINRAALTSRDAQHIQENPAMWVLEHELWHYMWNRGGSMTDELATTVRKMYEQHPGIARGDTEANWNKLLDGVIQKRNSQGLDIQTREQAAEEVVADFFRNYAFRSEAAIKALCQTNGNLGERILSWLRYKIDDLKLRRSKDSWARDLLKVERQYALALREAGHNPLNTAKTKTSNGGIAYSSAEGNSLSGRFSNDTINKAKELVGRGASDEEVFRETGIYLMPNGDLLDGDTGTILWRANINGDTQRSDDVYDAESEEARGWPVQGYDLAADEGGSESASRRRPARKTWEELTSEQQKAVADVIDNHITNNANADTQTVKERWSPEELYEFVYDGFRDGDAATEWIVGQVIPNVDRLIEELHRVLPDEAYSASGNITDDLLNGYVGVANPRTGVTAEEDEAYMRAALAGDTETAGRMVREMYERNGLMHVYRGEPKATGSWTQVNMDNFKGPSSGMFAATDIDTARAAEYTHSYAREDLKTKPLSYGDEMPVLQQFADGVAQRIGRGLNLVAESYYMDDEGNAYSEDGKGREHHWALRDADTGDIFADSTELTTLADAAKRKAARMIGGNPQNIYNSINDPFAGRILDLFVKFDNANEYNARGDEWDKIYLNGPKGVTLYSIEVTPDAGSDNSFTVTAYPIDESFDAESSSASERGAKSVTFTSEDDYDYSYNLENAFKELFGPKSDVSEFFLDYAEWDGEGGATLDKVGVRDKNGRYVSPELFPEAEATSTDALAVRDKAAGYDGTIIRNVRDGGSRTTTDTVSFNPNYIKSADAITYDDDGNIIPLSQRGDFERNELRYSGDLDVDQLLSNMMEEYGTAPNITTEQAQNRADADAKLQADINQYGAIDQGRNPRARDIEVPKQTNDLNKVSQWVRSLVESGKLTDDQAQNVLRMVVEQDYGTYIPTSQAERMEEARAYIAERQPLQAQQEFHDMVMQGKFGVKTNAIGIQLLSDASARGDFASVLDIAADLQLAATEAGQSAQIFNVLKELKGVGSAWYMQKVIDRMNSKYADQIQSGKMQKISVDPALMADLAKATTVDQIAAAEEAVAKDVARQLPLTWADRLSSWRYFSMLANPTTHFRNITGNLLMKGLDTMKNVVGTGLEQALGINQSERAHSILTAEDKSTWATWAQQSYEEQARNLSGGSKLGFESFIKQNMRSFDTKWIDALAQFNFNALEGEDIAFIKPAYKNALMRYMKAQGYTLNEKGVAGKVDAKGQFVEMTKAQQNAAIEWASEQAWKATFRDSSSLATLLNKISKENAVSRLLVEGVMPFKKTPINIAKRGVEYSPAGIVTGLVQLKYGVKKGKVTTAQAIDTLSSGITGTALMALGVMLSKLGLIRAGGEKNKKLETYLEDTGDQTYAMKFGDKSINMSSIAPATIPLFMGVALNEMIEQGGDSLDLSTITDTIAGTLNPFMEMSFMSSLNSALKNYNNDGIGGALGSTILSAAQNYGSQYLPTLGGKIAQFLDPTRRTTKSDATSPIGGNLDYYWRSLVKKIPGAEATLQPDVDVWGRTDTKDSFGDWALDFANKFILPTNIKVTNRDAVDNELIRVVESTGETGFLPSDGNKYFTVNKQKYTMNAKQYTQYSQERGQAAYAALKDTMASASYQSASDENKAAMLKKALDAAYKQVNNVWKEKLGAYDK